MVGVGRGGHAAGEIAKSSKESNVPDEPDATPPDAPGDAARGGPVVFSNHLDHRTTAIDNGPDVSPVVNCTVVLACEKVCIYFSWSVGSTGNCILK